eukprot:CAMPEP_0171638904 /NCGR_PEP_ID=MMETSP0990-20121206/29319_1 /TAXON_ID=483369 /ORGANISM="non described non described, Strain CCMP2098" /LENGTH=60 /DNA_ID=CAMNT_0012212387 /DNA_START=468 /DNA_END=650 /DNA_ORIENTATION=-
MIVVLNLDSQRTLLENAMFFPRELPREAILEDITYDSEVFPFSINFQNTNGDAFNGTAMI